MLDARRLRLLRELQTRGTITAVAEALAYSPSHVSQQLAILEREAGATLLRRQGRGVQLTPQGEVLAAHARGILDRLELAEREVRASLGEPSGTVRVAVFQSAALALLPGVLRLLREEHPALRIEMVQHEPEAALVDTSAGDFDLVVAEQYPGHAAPHQPGLDRQLLTTDALTLAVPLESGVGSLDETRDAAWIMEPTGAASRHWAEQRCRVAGFEPDVRYETADLQAQLRLVETGNGVCIVNELTVGTARPELRLLPLPGHPRREIFTSARHASAGDPGIAAVRDALARVAAAIPAA
ncbi:HTH-type transcriptional regulator GltC [Pseudoclavibacter triregionum]|nr:HTH-type transcriptional regulator GltC [Pseudoclavibacter triregionum]